MMPEDYSFGFGPRKYVVCINCEKVIGKWSNRYPVEIYQCPKCSEETHVLITGVGKDIRPKIRSVKKYIN
jgi:hypothetical protein